MAVRWSAGAVTAALALLVSVQPASGQDSIAARIERLGTLRPPIHESSGVAVSRSHPGLLWTHNDSGDSARIYAINQSGGLLAVYRVPGAGAEDWEDIARGPCPVGQGSCLFIGDVGDNAEERPSVVIYVVPEPAPPVAPTREILRTERARPLLVVYPDRPHDVEAIAVDPQGNLMLITKGRTLPIRIYHVPRSAFRGTAATATLADSLPIIPQPNLGRWVTGAAISPSGTRLVVRTYTELYFYRIGRNGRLVPEGAPCWLGAAEPQGEAVDFLDEHYVVLTSESTSNQLGPILRVSCSASRRDGGQTR